MISASWYGVRRAYAEVELCIKQHHLDDLVRINRAWLHKEPKALVLQANTKLVQ